MSIWPDGSPRNDIEPPDPWLDWQAEREAALEDQPAPGEHDPGPEVDDEGGMSEYRHAPDWAGVERAEYERDARAMAGGPRTYVTEISAPRFGDGGRQQLHSQPLEAGQNAAAAGKDLEAGS